MVVIHSLIIYILHPHITLKGKVECASDFSKTQASNLINAWKAGKINEQIVSLEKTKVHQAINNVFVDIFGKKERTKFLFCTQCNIVLSSGGGQAK